MSLWAAGAPSLFLLTALGMLNWWWPSFCTLVVSIALLTGMEAWTVYAHSEALLFIFLATIFTHDDLFLLL